MQERVGRTGLLRVVVPGRVRVHLRLQDALRPVRRRHERRGAHALRAELRALVRRLPQLPTASGRTPRDVIRPPSSDDGDSTCIVVIVARTPRAGTVGNNLAGE